MDNLISYQEVKQKVIELKKNMKTVGLVGGHFDLLHIGHVLFVNECHKFCDVLFVYVHNDESTKNIKGLDRPFVSAYERALLLCNLKTADFVFVNTYVIDSSTLFDFDKMLISEVQPNIYFCVGNEYSDDVRVSLLQKSFKDVEFKVLQKKSETISTTIVGNKLLKKVTSFCIEKTVSDEYSKNMYGELINISNLSNCNLGKVAAIIEKDREILVSSSNMKVKNSNCWCEFKNATIDKYNHEPCSALHAEENAILKAIHIGLNLQGATIYTTSTPCFHCAKLIVNYGIKKVIYYNEYTDSIGKKFLVDNGIEVYKCKVGE